MDDYPSPSAGKSLKLELYTHRLMIQGTVTSPFSRTSDLLNRSPGDFIAAHDALISNIGQRPSDKPFEGPVMIGIRLLHLVAEVPGEGKPVGQPMDKSPQRAPVGGREAFVQKNNYRCLIRTDVYTINGYCHLHPGTTLEHLLRGTDLFVPMTMAVIQLVAHPEVTWRRDVVIVNRQMIGAMYLVPGPSAADPTARAPNP